MTAEEIGLNEALEAAGITVVETDLGEYIIQLAEETPFHLVAPALHKTKEQVAQLEETLTLLLSTTEKLFDENISLKEKEKQLLLERANLLSKNDKIRTQVEAMISRLKAMDKV